MKLGAWLAQNNHSYSAFAQRVDTRAENIRRYCLPEGHSEHRKPRPRRMRRIISETAGAVTANDFYETPPQAAEDAA